MSNDAVDAVVNPSTKAGGTLKLLSDSDADSWDSKRAYYGWVWNMMRLYVRPLIGYGKVNGEDPSQYKLVPDLATSLGKHNANYTQWTYTLKSGVKWENGKPVTPMDVKYGVERNWAADVLPGGPSQYFTGTIKAPKGYPGPYKGGDLSSITTTKNSITFNLSTPYADFDYLMAIPASAPVPYKVEGGSKYVGANYYKHPVSDGPFKIKSYTPNKSIIFVRNPEWSQSTDTIRHPLVNEVDLNIDTNPTDVDNKLQAGDADAWANTNVGPEFRAKILSTPSLGKYADDPEAASVDYMSVMQSVITNVHCRRAIFYAFDKLAYQRVLGGPAAGVVAPSMTPPGVPGNDPNYNPYPSGPNDQGDLTKAKQELQQCGKPNGFSTKWAYPTPSDTQPQVFKLEQAALARVGIKVTPVTQDASTYYSTFIGSPANIKNQGIGIAWSGWGADFPRGQGFWYTIADSKAILPVGNSNYVSLKNPTVDGVIAQSFNGKATEADWKKLDQAVMESAVYLPLVWSRRLYYRNPRLTNVTCNVALAFGIYDFVNVGVS